MSVSLTGVGVTDSPNTGQAPVAQVIVEDTSTDNSPGESTQTPPVSRGTQVLNFLGWLYGISKPDNIAFQEFARETVKVVDEFLFKILGVKE